METQVQTSYLDGDRRQELRHAVERPCRICPAGMPGVEFHGFTGNVSRSGLYLTIPRQQQRGWIPTEGDAVLVLVELPSSGGRQPRLLECAGRVVRAQGAAGGSLSVAMSLQSMRFLTRGEASLGSIGAPPVQ